MKNSGETSNITLHGAEGADAKTLRQKDRILTILWRAMGHRRSEIFQVDKTEAYLSQKYILIWIRLFCFGDVPFATTSALWLGIGQKSCGLETVRIVCGCGAELY